MDPLDALRHKVGQIFGNSLRPGSWGEPQLMTKALAEVRKTFDKPDPMLPGRSIAQALQAYRQYKKLSSFLDLKYTCFGIGQFIDENWCLLEDHELLSKLLTEVDILQTEPRKFRKCYQGLLAGYFSYPILAADTQPEGRHNWERLRDFLNVRLTVARQALPVASWLMMLEEHRNLLGPKPCERYACGLLDGELGDLRPTLQEGLGVPRESWVWQEVILSQTEIICGREDKPFQAELDKLIRIIHTNSFLSSNLVIRCAAMLICRYAQCLTKAEHPALRDLAVTHIGNPWLKRTAWDAHVKTMDGRPHEEARQMINGWLKRRLIKDFFELLSEDGSADQRRLNYWLRFDPVIEDMWFALGPHANHHQGKDFKEFRSRAKGRMLSLEAPGVAQNNAFIMRLGGWVAVEFGAKGNACYIFNAEALPFDLTQSWVSGNDSGLKNKKGGERFIHRDSEVAGIPWEQKLDDIIAPLIGFRPPRAPHAPRQVIRRKSQMVYSPSPPMTTPRPPSSPPGREQEIMSYLTNTLKLPVEDNRAKGGALWVRMGNNKTDLCPLLTTLGFTYKSGKGWWKD